MIVGGRIDPRVLKEFAESDRQHEVIDAVIKQGSATKASKFLNINRRSVDKMLERLEGKAAKEGIAPHDLRSSDFFRVATPRAIISTLHAYFHLDAGRGRLSSTPTSQ